jgi:hypothetical protein
MSTNASGRTGQSERREERGGEGRGGRSRHEISRGLKRERGVKKERMEDGNAGVEAACVF